MKYLLNSLKFVSLATGLLYLSATAFAGIKFDQSAVAPRPGHLVGAFVFKLTLPTNTFVKLIQVYTGNAWVGSFTDKDAEDAAKLGFQVQLPVNAIYKIRVFGNKLTDHMTDTGVSDYEDYAVELDATSSNTDIKINISPLTSKAMIGQLEVNSASAVNCGEVLRTLTTDHDGALKSPH